MTTDKDAIARWAVYLEKTIGLVRLIADMKIDGEEYTCDRCIGCGLWGGQPCDDCDGKGVIKYVQHDSDAVGTLSDLIASARAILGHQKTT